MTHGIRTAMHPVADDIGKIGIIAGINGMGVHILVSLKMLLKIKQSDDWIGFKAKNIGLSMITPTTFQVRIAVRNISYDQAYHYCVEQHMRWGSSPESAQSSCSNPSTIQRVQSRF